MQTDRVIVLTTTGQLYLLVLGSTASWISLERKVLKDGQKGPSTTKKKDATATIVTKSKLAKEKANPSVEFVQVVPFDANILFAVSSK